MGRSPSGRLWAGGYLALAVAPLIAALLADPFVEVRSFRVEFGVACGFVAFALIAFEFALVSRVRVASLPFGTDALMLFHRHMGVAALGFAVVHVLFLLGRETRSATSSGALALGCVLVLVGLALARQRWSLRYEPWRRLHGILAVVAICAMLHHALAERGYTEHPLVASTLIAYAALFLVLMLRYRFVRPLLLVRKPWEVVENRFEGGDTRTLVLQPVGHRGLDFEPGQFVWLLTGRHPLSAQDHPLSISSSAEQGDERRLELSIKALGDWSRSTVPTLGPGTRVWIDGPFGTFTTDRVAAQGFVMIAGGIGITPMLSMLRTMRDRGDRRRVLVLHAARNSERAVFSNELATLAGALDLTVVSVYQEPGADWHGERGFLRADLLRRHLPVWFRQAHFFVCGPGPMMASVERILTETGVPSELVHTERFDMV